jgi:hypothetical protein
LYATEKLGGNRLSVSVELDELQKKRAELKSAL